MKKLTRYELNKLLKDIIDGKLRTLEDVEIFLRKIFVGVPHYTFSRGNKTRISDTSKCHKDFEVIQVFCNNMVIAEFWKGFYDSYPDTYTSGYDFCNNASYGTHFCVRGDLRTAAEWLLLRVHPIVDNHK